MLHCENVFVTLRCLCCKTCWWQSHVFVAKNIIVVDNVFVAKLVGDKVTSLLRKMSLLLNLLVTKSRLCCEKCLGCKTCCIAKNIIVVDNVFVGDKVTSLPSNDGINFLAYNLPCHFGAQHPLFKIDYAISWCHCHIDHHFNIFKF